MMREMIARYGVLCVLCVTGCLASPESSESAPSFAALIRPPDDAVTQNMCTLEQSAQCTLGASQVEEHAIEELGSCQFALEKKEDAAFFKEVTSQFQALHGDPVPLEGVRFERAAQRTISRANADYMREHEDDLVSFQWQGEDNDSPWYPQGMTGEEDAEQDVDARPRQMLVSWYDRAAARGVRVTLVRFLPERIVYRHILLVEPVRRESGELDIEPLRSSSGDSLHGGGIVWMKNFLYVADTYGGMRVFDLRHLYEIEPGEKFGKIGMDAEGAHAFDYSYVLPQRASYAIADGACRPSFSFIGLDRTQSPPVMSTGEYRHNHVRGRILFWEMRPNTGWLREASDGVVYAKKAYVSGQSRMQGALSIDGDIVISTAKQVEDKYGRLYQTRPGERSTSVAWPYGAEDLYYERSTGRIWTPAEYPDHRDTLSIEYEPYQVMMSRM